MEVTLLLVMLSVAGALPLLGGGYSGWDYLRAAGKVFFQYALPLLFFFASALLVPDSKANALMGWLDGFFLGKLAMTPMVLWAVAASYVRDVLRLELRPWMVLGHLAGALAATSCALIGLAIVPREMVAMGFMVVPVYTAVWYDIRAVQVWREQQPLAGPVVATAAGSGVLFAAALGWSWQVYQELPEEPPECFVVTAASRGHEAVVGPMRDHMRRGVRRRVNDQLLTFWALEARWRVVLPGSHRLARRVYNRVGPLVARRLRHPLLADAMCLVLKPAEWAARAVVGRAEAS
jgi:hypothetical protein